VKAFVHRAWTRLATPEACLSAVRAVADYKKRCGHLACHPYNPELPQESTWWLFPPVRRTGNWPAYHMGKFIFRVLPGFNTLFAGLHVEKGIGAQLAQAFGTRRAATLTLGPNWIWHRFLTNLTDGSVEAALETIRKRSHMPPWILLDAGPAGDENRFHPVRSRYYFRSPEGDRIVLQSHHVGERGIPFVENAMNLADLRDRLERLASPQGDMIWVNLWIGCAVGRERLDHLPPWDGSDFWYKALEPLAHWVRPEKN